MTEGKTALDVLTALQVKYFQETQNQRKGWLTRRMLRLADQIDHLEWCLFVSPEVLPEEEDR